MENNFRLIMHANDDENTTWAIHRVYYDSDNNPIMYDTDVAEKSEITEQIFKKIREKPWLKEINGELFEITK